MAVIYLVNTNTGGGPHPPYQGAGRKEIVEWQIKNDPNVKHKIVDFVCEFRRGATPFEKEKLRFTRGDAKGTVDDDADEARYPYKLTLKFEKGVQFADPSCPEVIIKNNVALWFEAPALPGGQPLVPP